VEPGIIVGGRYQLVEQVAEGNLATVWQGVDRDTEDPVAVKVMKRPFAVVGGHHLELFIEEARIGSLLEHPNLVQVRDLIVEDAEDGKLYCEVMEWIDGTDLRGLIARASAAGQLLPAALVATIGVGVLHGLAAAHERKVGGGILSPVIHRDVSPPNVMLGTDGAIKLGDFGMSRAKDRIAEHTAPGVVKGTLAYVPPECLKGDPPGTRSDIYSLGCTLWEALAGERAFPIASPVALINKIRAGAIQPLVERRPDTPPRLAAAIHRALSNDPHARFSTARAMADELAAVANELGVVDGDALVGAAVSAAMQRASSSIPDES
jgi:serine/threonine protein kinase